MTRFLIVEDHPLFADALQSAIRLVHADACIVEAGSIDGALDVVASQPSFDLALLDLCLPGCHGTSALVRLRDAYPKLPILVVSSLEEAAIVNQAMSLGIAGYVPKSTSRKELAFAIGEALSGSIYVPKQLLPLKVRGGGGTRERKIEDRLKDLTPRQLAVLEMLGRGLQNKQIAAEMKLTETTVKAHVSEILRKLNVFTRTNAVIEVAKCDLGALRNRN